MDNKHCRFCGKELKYTMADLGLSPVSNEYISKEYLDRGQYYYPLEVKVCDACLLAQAMIYEKPENIFTNYKYFSSFSTSWLSHCKNYVEKIIERLQLGKNSMVYEIACNDGYLLQYFKPHNIPICGVEPAENVAKETMKKEIDVVVDFFSKDTAPFLVESRGRADLIIGNNVLAHVPDIGGFVAGLKILLKTEGTITMEFPHLKQMLELNQFDTIYHEHFSYLSLLAVKRIFGDNGLKIYDVEELPTHGGSLRIYAAHDDNHKLVVSQNVNKVLTDECVYGMEAMQIYEEFGEKIRKIKRDSGCLLAKLKSEGKKIVAFGAAAKGNTFLNYCGIGRDYIDFVADSSTAKQGFYLPGTYIPIVSPDLIATEKPDYIVLLAWNLKDELKTLLEYTREWECKFITFIPETEVF